MQKVWPKDSCRQSRNGQPGPSSSTIRRSLWLMWPRDERGRRPKPGFEQQDWVNPTIWHRSGEGLLRLSLSPRSTRWSAGPLPGTPRRAGTTTAQSNRWHFGRRKKWSKANAENHTYDAKLLARNACFGENPRAPPVRRQGIRQMTLPSKLRQIRDVPAAAQRFDQQHAGVHAAP